MDDVVVAGGGPAGALAALILARSGARVRLFERARFPRHKLCGDTLNPGALGLLSKYVDLSDLTTSGGEIHGMVVTGPDSVSVRARYGDGLTGRAIARGAFDHWLLNQAAASGAQVEEGIAVKCAQLRHERVTGVGVAGRNRSCVDHPAQIVIAADGRRSGLAFQRRLARQPLRPRRWAIGGYFSGVEGCDRFGEMHVRAGHYIGVAPLPGDVTNACLVVPHAPGDPPLVAPGEILTRALHGDADLRHRFSNARLTGPVVMLGPMAVDTLAAGEPGLLLAGDAAGFIDPMTGDGLRLALAGAELAAETALDALAGRITIDRAHTVLRQRRETRFRSKWRFNRALRLLVASPRGVSCAAGAARVWPSLFEGIVRYAGDCGRRP